MRQIVSFAVCALTLVACSDAKSTVTVPDTVGKSQARARHLLADRHLDAAPKLVVAREPEGLVVAQSPKPGTNVGTHTRVVLRISGGTSGGGVGVPDLTGEPVAAASQALRAEHFRVAVDPPRSSRTVKRGAVVATLPTAGTDFMMGGTVHIEPSNGPSSD